MTNIDFWQYIMGFSPVEMARTKAEERRADSSTRVMVSVLQAWLAEGQILPIHALDIMRHRGVSQASRMRIIDSPATQAVSTTLEKGEEHNNGAQL